MKGGLREALPFLIIISFYYEIHFLPALFIDTCP